MTTLSSKDTDITTIPEAALWAELVRRTQERKRTGEASGWPKVTLAMVMGGHERFAIKRLDETDVSDPERAHDEADDILKALVPPEVREAYDRLVARAPWWACA